MTDAPRISDEEIKAFWEVHAGLGRTREALAAFLSARVPEEDTRKEWCYDENDKEEFEIESDYAKGFNACREAVLKGGKE